MHEMLLENILQEGTNKKLRLQIKGESTLTLISISIPIAITCGSVDPDPCHHTVPQGYNELFSTVLYAISISILDNVIVVQDQL